jgi:nucleotide-binding universal stress UspA family protein
MFKHILLATDGSMASDAAAVLALELARTHGAKLTAVYVITPYPYLGVGESNAYGFNAYMVAAQQHAAEAHAKVTALSQQGEAKFDVQLRVVEDSGSARGILHTADAEGADLIIVGSHGRTGIVRLMLGSVANRVVSESLVPVLVVR